MRGIHGRLSIFGRGEGRVPLPSSVSPFWLATSSKVERGPWIHSIAQHLFRMTARDGGGPAQHAGQFLDPLRALQPPDS